ncbi:MAG: CpXC domain-containing protein [Bacteroidales bacterium]|nr:CpXC domain-containing protein [Bacteroidales bacterium]
MICVKCGRVWEPGIPTTIDASLKEKVKDGSLFLLRCPQCGTPCLAEGPFIYHDALEKILVVFSPTTLNVQQVPDGYTCRMVEDLGSLMEKVKIFDAGLSDIAVEICKFVTRRELGKDVDLKFLKIDGADGEMTFTYPQDGQMQMLEVGGNVYADALAIISRNPSLQVSGMQKINYAWLSERLS